MEILSKEPRLKETQSIETSIAVKPPATRIVPITTVIPQELLTLFDKPWFWRRCYYFGTAILGGVMMLRGMFFGDWLIDKELARTGMDLGMTLILGAGAGYGVTAVVDDRNARLHQSTVVAAALDSARPATETIKSLSQPLDVASEAG